MADGDSDSQFGKVQLARRHLDFAAFHAFSDVSVAPIASRFRLDTFLSGTKTRRFLPIPKR